MTPRRILRRSERLSREKTRQSWEAPLINSALSPSPDPSHEGRGIQDMFSHEGRGIQDMFSREGERNSRYVLPQGERNSGYALLADERKRQIRIPLIHFPSLDGRGEGRV